METSRSLVVWIEPPCNILAWVRDDQPVDLALITQILARGERRLLEIVSDPLQHSHFYLHVGLHITKPFERGLTTDGKEEGILLDLRLVTNPGTMSRYTRMIPIEDGIMALAVDILREFRDVNAWDSRTAKWVPVTTVVKERDNE